MQKINTTQLLNELKKVSPDGFEVSTNMGFLSTTKAIYFKNGLVFVFLMEYDFIFDTEIGLSTDEFKKEYENWMWKIEQIIC